MSKGEVHTLLINNADLHAPGMHATELCRAYANDNMCIKIAKSQAANKETSVDMSWPHQWGIPSLLSPLSDCSLTPTKYVIYPLDSYECLHSYSATISLFPSIRILVFIDHCVITQGIAIPICITCENMVPKAVANAICQTSSGSTCTCLYTSDRYVHGSSHVLPDLVLVRQQGDIPYGVCILFLTVYNCLQKQILAHFWDTKHRICLCDAAPGFYQPLVIQQFTLSRNCTLNALAHQGR